MQVGVTIVTNTRKYLCTLNHKCSPIISQHFYINTDVYMIYIKECHVTALYVVATEKRRSSHIVVDVRMFIEVTREL